MQSDAVLGNESFARQVGKEGFFHNTNAVKQLLPP
jgi:hypothetical protein